MTAPTRLAPHVGLAVAALSGCASEWTSTPRALTPPEPVERTATVPADYADMAAVAPTWEGGEVRFRDYGPFAVWLDTFTRVPALTVHWLVEHDYANHRRPTEFAPDLELPEAERVPHEAYAREGYREGGGPGPFDRGMLVPQEDMDAGEDELLTYQTTNVAAQQVFFNRQKWRIEVEELIRAEVAEQTPEPGDRAVVFTGPLFFAENDLRLPSDDETVLVPGGLFKVVYFTGQDDVVDRTLVRVWLQDTGRAYRRALAWESVERVEELAGVRFRLAAGEAE